MDINDDVVDEDQLVDDEEVRSPPRTKISKTDNKSPEPKKRASGDGRRSSGRDALIRSKPVTPRPREASRKRHIKSRDLNNDEPPRDLSDDEFVPIRSPVMSSRSRSSSSSYSPESSRRRDASMMKSDTRHSIRRSASPPRIPNEGKREISDDETSINAIIQNVKRRHSSMTSSRTASSVSLSSESSRGGSEKYNRRHSSYAKNDSRRSSSITVRDKAHIALVNKLGILMGVMFVIIDWTIRKLFGPGINFFEIQKSLFDLYQSDLEEVVDDQRRRHGKGFALLEQLQKPKGSMLMTFGLSSLMIVAVKTLLPTEYHNQENIRFCTEIGTNLLKPTEGINGMKNRMVGSFATFAKVISGEDIGTELNSNRSEMKGPPPRIRITKKTTTSINKESNGTTPKQSME